MYNIVKLDHKITYNDANLYDKFNVINEDEKEQLKDIIYKYDLLMIFNLTDFLEDEINDKIRILYDNMIQYKELENLLTEMSHLLFFSTFKSVNEDILQVDTFTSFIMLFSYDNLFLFYPCICEFINMGTISKDKLESIKNNISHYINN